MKVSKRERERENPQIGYLRPNHAFRVIPEMREGR